jgi:hypothetical protein
MSNPAIVDHCLRGARDQHQLAAPANGCCRSSHSSDFVSLIPLGLVLGLCFRIFLLLDIDSY